MKKINTTRFGEIEEDEGKIITFSQGIPAFEDEHEFVLLPVEEGSPYWFMQSVHTPGLAFLITTPFVFFSDYEFSLEDAVVQSMGITKEEDLSVYVLLTVPPEGIRAMTANLLAPVVINTQNQQARQIILEKSHYTTKHRLFQKPDAPAKEAD